MVEVSERSALQPCEGCGCLRWPLAECWGCMERQDVRRQALTWVGLRVALVAFLVGVVALAVWEAVGQGVSP